MVSKSRSGLVSEAENDREILLFNLHCQSRPVVGAGSPEQNGPLLLQQGSQGASARQGPRATGFNDSGQQSLPVSLASRGIHSL